MVLSTFVATNPSTGSPHHLDAARQEAERAHVANARRDPHASRLHFVVPTANSGTLTYDGMDVCAARTLNEVQQEIGDLERAGSVVREFSVMGYSLGGRESLLQVMMC